jgi:site-specific recombinase XerD
MITPPPTGFHASLPKGHGYDDVQEFVGHANRAMTKRYGRMNVKRLERVLRPKLPRG